MSPVRSGVYESASATSFSDSAQSGHARSNAVTSLSSGGPAVVTVKPRRSGPGDLAAVRAFDSAVVSCE